MLRYVFDSTVIVSAFLFNYSSPPGLALLLALSLGTLLMSKPQADELEDVLSRRKFDRYATVEERKRLLRDLIRDAELIEITQTVQACRDPKDAKILELAINGHADYVVSGDRDLLVMNPFRGIVIVRPAAFLAFGWFRRVGQSP